jgi:hypothetical protein
MTVTVTMTVENEDGHALTDAEISEAYTKAVEILTCAETKAEIAGKIAESGRLPAPKPPRRPCARKRVSR